MDKSDYIQKCIDDVTGRPGHYRAQTVTTTPDNLLRVLIVSCEECSGGYPVWGEECFNQPETGD